MRLIDESKRHVLGLSKVNPYASIKSSPVDDLPKDLSYEDYVGYVVGIDFKPYYRSVEHRARRALDFTATIREELIATARHSLRSVFSWDENAAAETPEQYAAKCEYWRSVKDSAEIVVYVFECSAEEQQKSAQTIGYRGLGFNNAPYMVSLPEYNLVEIHPTSGHLLYKNKYNNSRLKKWSSRASFVARPSTGFRAPVGVAGAGVAPPVVREYNEQENPENKCAKFVNSNGTVISTWFETPSQDLYDHPCLAYCNHEYLASLSHEVAQPQPRPSRKQIWQNDCVREVSNVNLYNIATNHAFKVVARDLDVVPTVADIYAAANAVTTAEEFQDVVHQVQVRRAAAITGI